MGGLAASAAGWLALPTLQSPRQSAQSQVTVAVERARRLLTEFNHQIVQKSLLLDDLAEADVDVDIEDAGELLEVATDEYQAHHVDHWATYEPNDYALPAPPRSAKASYGNLAGQVEEGIHARDAILAQNDQLLGEAMNAINTALAVQAGDVSGRSFAEANRLKGVIYYHQGRSQRIRAGSRRKAAARKKQRLALLAGRAAHLRREIEGLGSDDVDSLTASLGERIAGLTEALADVNARKRQAESEVAQLAQRLMSAQARVAAALAKMDSIRREGVDFENPQGGDAFGEALLAQDRLFRAADREVASLQFGQYPKARIDRSGDLLRGRFMEGGSSDNLTTEYGITHYQDIVAVLAERSEHHTNLLDRLRQDLQELEAIKTIREAEQNHLATKLDGLIRSAGELYDALATLEAEAFDMEDAAIALFDNAGSAFREASTAAQTWVRDAGSVAQSLSPEAKQNSAFAKRAGSGWMGGHITAQHADCELAKAWIYHVRFTACGQSAELLASAAQTLALTQADADAEKAKSNEAHDAAVAAIESAVTDIKQAHRNAGKHWTFVAQLAGANDLLALLGHQDYLADALEAYRNAINGRESETYAQKYVKRIGELEAG